MNFDEINDLSSYMRQQIMPHVFKRVPIIDMGLYLTRLSECSELKWIKTNLQGFPLTYVVDPIPFLKKYKKNCINFFPSGQPNDGSLQIIYQISPTLHVLAKLYLYIENAKVKSYLLIQAFYKDHEEFLNFYDENFELRVVGNDADKPIGFTPTLVSDMVGFSSEKRSDF